MSWLPCPQGPEWKIDWEQIDSLSWIQRMKNCPQNPERHAEGDVWTHVHMVCEALVNLPSWRALPENVRPILFAASLLHDVAKPICTRQEADGSYSSRGHSWRGAVMARKILWQKNYPFQIREQIAALVRHHLVPFYLVEAHNAQKLTIEISQTVPCTWLSILAEADARGRICPDPDRLLRQIDHFREYARQQQCYESPFPFSSGNSRFRFFHGDEVEKDPVVYQNPGNIDRDPEGPHVYLMSGLPSAGKDYWIRNHLPKMKVICLDAIRSELGVPYADPNGEVIVKARNLAKEYLTQKESFIWNATNLTRFVRSDCIGFFLRSDAKITLIYVESSPDKIQQNNRNRNKRVPDGVMNRVLDRWEVPEISEAHEVFWYVGNQMITEKPE